MLKEASVRYAIHVNWAGASFVKEYDFFVSQGGLTEEWGRAWTIVEAEDIYAARVIAEARTWRAHGLYCKRCGRENTECICHGATEQEGGER